MSYIGSTPTTQNFIAGTDSFNGTGSQTNFTLSRFVNSTNDIQVVVNNVVQYPPNYSVSGNTLTISPAPSSGTNNVYVRYLSTTLQSVAPVPGSTQQFASGTAANPSITFLNDTNTGIFSPAADTIAFTEGGVEAMRIDSSANVGIGTSSPAFRLDVRGGNIRLAANSSGASDAVLYFGNAATNYIFGGDSSNFMTFGTNNAERMRIDSSGNVGIGLAPTGTGFLEIKAGTTSAVPLELNAGTNASTAVAGGVEYDGRVFYATPQGTQRGVIPGAQFFRLNSGLVGANVNTAQSMFGVGVTLSASTVYQFEAIYAISKSAGATSHNVGLSFGGTATVNNIAYDVLYHTDATAFSSVTQSCVASFIQTASNSTITIASTTAARFWVFTLRGSVSINAGGTFIPQYTLSAAPGGAYTTAIGSYFSIYPISASGANTSVGTWA